MSATPTLFALYVSFVRIGAVLLGGGFAMFPLLEEELVRRRKWITAEEATDFFALAQLLPGVVAINVSMLAGNRLRGILGNVVAALGTITVPFLLILAYAIAYASIRDNAYVHACLEGVRPAVAGMILGAGLKMLHKAGFSPFRLAVAILAAVAILFVHVPVVGLVLVGIVVGLLRKK